MSASFTKDATSQTLWSNLGSSDYDIQNVHEHLNTVIEKAEGSAQAKINELAQKDPGSITQADVMSVGYEVNKHSIIVTLVSTLQACFNTTFKSLVQNIQYILLSFFYSPKQSQMDLNHRMQESKSCALPNLAMALKKWWKGVDSNHRTRRERIYSPPRLATSLPFHL